MRALKKIVSPLDLAPEFWEYPSIHSISCGVLCRSYSVRMAIDGIYLNDTLKRPYGANRVENSAICYLLFICVHLGFPNRAKK